MIPDDWIWLEGTECPNCDCTMLFSDLQAPEESHVRCAMCGATYVDDGHELKETER